MSDTAKMRYCAICAAPCLSARDPPLTSLPTNPPLDPYPYQDPEWLTSYTLLGYPNITLPPTSSEPEPSPSSRHNRQIPIHSYCLSSVLRLETSAHGRRMVQVWSLPKWTGCIDWKKRSPYEDEVQEKMMGYGAGVDSRSWMGLGAQLDRWAAGERHYLNADLVSPIDIPNPQPGPSTFGLSIRPRQLHRLATLPPHILLQIATYLLDDFEDPSYALLRRRLAHPPRPRPNQVAAPHPDLRTLLNTSLSLRYYPFPSYFWKELVRDRVDQYKYQLLYRWDASPGRAAISLDRLERVLEEEFSAPVETALTIGCGVASDGQADGGGQVVQPYTARDVFYWWAFSPAWRSRRRVWRCVVFGAAQARDADWL